MDLRLNFCSLHDIRGTLLVTILSASDTFREIRNFIDKSHHSEANMLWYAPVIYHLNAFYVFGGWVTGSTNIIAKLDASTTTWSDVGRLQQARYIHSVIHNGANFIVVGGAHLSPPDDTVFGTETCTDNEGSINCTIQTPYLVGYRGSELSLVEGDFCKNYP